MFTIAVNAADLDRIEGDLTARLARLLPAQLAYIQSVWQAAVLGMTLPGMRRPIHDETYARMVVDPRALDYPFNGDPFRGQIVALNTGLARRYEEGYRSFDMKPGLLRGPHAKTAKDGSRYNVIPFTHSVPTAVGQKGTPMPSEIYALARRLRAGRSLQLPGEMRMWGVRSKVPAQVNAQAQARQQHFFLRQPQPGPMLSPYTWQASPFQGMRRIHRRGHTTYQTYRTVSTRSDPSSWIHPGQPANPVIRAVRDHVLPEVVQAIRAALGGR